MGFELDGRIERGEHHITDREVLDLHADARAEDQVHELVVSASHQCVGLVEPHHRSARGVADLRLVCVLVDVTDRVVRLAVGIDQSRRDVGPAAFPVWVAAGMIGLILLDVVVSRRLVRPTNFADIKLAVAVGGLLALSVWLASRFGFFTVLPFALFAGLWLAGSRHHIANVAFSILMPAVLWLLFDRVLLIPIAGM